MKERQGFESNSSSSSFVIGKNYMNERQIKEFESLIYDMDDSYIIDSELYFHGTVDNYDFDKLSVFLRSEGLKEFFSCQC